MISLDRPAPGLVVAQPKRGFRYGAEAFWLVGFALDYAVPDRALDLGTGSGILALLLGRQGVVATGIDIRPEWGPLWAQTLAESSGVSSVTLRCGDVLNQPSERWPLVISNPPFFAAGAGPTSPDPWKSAARTESSATLKDFVRVGIAQLSVPGQLCLVFPTARWPEVQAVVGAHGGWIHQAIQVGERRVLVRILRGEGANSPLRRVDDHGDLVASWYARAQAEIAVPLQAD